MTTKIYETFLQRMKETNEVKELQSSNVKIIQAALLPAAPISPNISTNNNNVLFTFFWRHYIVCWFILNLIEMQW